MLEVLLRARMQSGECQVRRLEATEGTIVVEGAGEKGVFAEGHWAAPGWVGEAGLGGRWASEGKATGGKRSAEDWSSPCP